MQPAHNMNFCEAKYLVDLINVSRCSEKRGGEKSCLIRDMHRKSLENLGCRTRSRNEALLVSHVAPPQLLGALARHVQLGRGTQRISGDHIRDFRLGFESGNFWGLLLNRDAQYCTIYYRYAGKGEG